MESLEELSHSRELGYLCLKKKKKAKSQKTSRAGWKNRAEGTMTGKLVRVKWRMVGAIQMEHFRHNSSKPNL